MITISHIIEQKIQNTPFLAEYLNQGLINISALARQMRPDIEKELGKAVRDSTLIMALNRMPKKASQLNSKKIKDILKDINDISLRSSLVDYTFQNSGSIKKNIAKFIKVTENNFDIFFTLSQGIYESTIIVNKSLEDELNEIFINETCINIEKDVTAINIRLPEINTKVKGVYYMVFKHFADNNINVKDVVSTSNELILLIESFNAKKAFLALNEFKK